MKLVKVNSRVLEKLLSSERCDAYRFKDNLEIVCVDKDGIGQLDMAHVAIGFKNHLSDCIKLIKDNNLFGDNGTYYIQEFEQIIHEVQNICHDLERSYQQQKPYSEIVKE